MIISKKHLTAVLSAFSFIALTGCASTVPSADFKKPIADTYRLCSNDDARVKFVATEGLTLNGYDLHRLKSRIQQAIDTKKSHIKCKTPDKRVFVLYSKITNYDEGNDFARFMLAGLGQIHIDGDFVLSLLPAGDEKVAEFTIQKTFAWGGLYGASIGIEDIEPAFAEGVAKAIVAQTAE